MAKISVKNNCSGSIHISINQWDAKGSVDFYEIDSGNSDTWDREDPDGRGFIMRVRTWGTPPWDLPYFVYESSNIEVYDTDWTYGQNVTDNGKQLNRAGQGGTT